jgi:dTDP-glucose 4,6-dehydratase
LVTGGAGFIGSAFVREALRRGHPVLNIDALTYAGDARTLASVRHHPSHHFVQSNICNQAAMEALIEDFRPNVVLNLAAETHVDRSIDGPSAFIETNVGGTFALLNAATAYWSRLAPSDRSRFRFVQISTDEVYGSLGAHGRFSEQTRYAPNSPYSASKAAGDLFAGAWFSTYGLPTIVSNCTNNYGPYQHPEKLIPTIIRKALAGAGIPIYGTGNNCRDWLHVDDHVDGLFQIIAHGAPGESYIFGTGLDVSNLELATLICDCLDERRPMPAGKKYQGLVEFVVDRPGHDHRYAVDPTKAETTLKWRARTSLTAGIHATVDWFLDNLDWVTRGTEHDRLGSSDIQGRA